MIDHGVVFDAPIITSGFPMGGEIGLPMNHIQQFQSDPMGAPFMYSEISSGAFQGPSSGGGKYTVNAYPEERTRSTAGPDETEKSSSVRCLFVARSDYVYMLCQYVFVCLLPDLTQVKMYARKRSV